MAGIARKTARIFGSNYAGSPTDQISQFGSLKAGSLTYSGDPNVIQSLSAWLNGWSGAVVLQGGNPNTPPMQDDTAVKYVLSYLIAYLLERGLPEWDTGTTYNQYDLCRKNGVIYESRTDANIGHDPASDHTHWASQIAALRVPSTGSTTVPVDGTGHLIDCFAAADFDTDNAWGATTHKFTAPVAGIYRVSAALQVDNVSAAAATIEFSLEVIFNGGGSVITGGTSVANPPGGRWYPQTNGTINLAAGDTLEIRLEANDTVNTGNVTVSNALLCIERIRAL